jgi:hypothetical protein
MFRGEIFRRSLSIVAISGFLFVLNGSNDGLYVTAPTDLVLKAPDLRGMRAPPTVSLEGKEPRTDQRHGWSAVPPSPNRDPMSAPKLKLHYRGTFPASVTIETDGAVAGQRLRSAAAMNVSTRVVFSNAWWSPQLKATLVGFHADQVPDGKFEADETDIRSEWKIRF